MARPKKTNLDYFPFDVDFFDDEKIVAIAGEFGIKGELTTIKLLCAIYRNGYYIEWNEMLQMKLARLLPGVSLELLNQIVSRLVKWGFFDPNLFSSVKVLTSRGIQNRYFEATKRWKLDVSKLPYILLENPENTVNVAETPVNVTLTPVNVAEIPIKEKKNKNKKKNSLARVRKKIGLPDFRALSREKVMIYLEKAGLAATDPDDFLDYYNTVGWIECGYPVTDWRAAARRWNARELRRGRGPAKPQAPKAASVSPATAAKMDKADPGPRPPANGVGGYEAFCRSIGIDPATPASEVAALLAKGGAGPKQT